nr:unnamed protein product [Digitaria exilis]
MGVAFVFVIVFITAMCICTSSSDTTGSHGTAAGDTSFGLGLCRCRALPLGFAPAPQGGLTSGSTAVVLCARREAAPSPLARPAPGRSPAATWPACGGGRAGPAELRRQLAFVLVQLSGLSAALPRRAVRPSWRAELRRWPAAPRRIPSPATHQVSSAAYPTPSRDNPPRPTPRARSVRARSASMARRRAKALHRAPHHFPSVHNAATSPPRARSHRLQPLAARTELESRAKFVLVPPPFPNPSRTELDHFPSFHFPHFSRALPNSPARNRIFPPNPHFRPPEHAHVEHLLRALPESHWCSRTPPTPVTASTLAGIEPAAAALPPHVAGELRASSSLPTATIRLVVSHWFFSPTSPTLSRRRLAGATPSMSRGPKFIFFLFPGFPVKKAGTCSRSFKRFKEGVLANGVYHLVPADEEGIPESGANEVAVDPETNNQLAQEGKPRSIT